MGKMSEISVPPDWDAEQDIKEFESRFGDDYKNIQEFTLANVEDVCACRMNVLAQALRYFLDQNKTPLRVPVNSLTVPELCHFLLGLIEHSKREPGYTERFRGHLAVVLYYEKQRALVLERHWTNPDHVWFVELADVADAIMAASWDFDEGMVCEHDNYTSVILTRLPE